MSSAKISVAGKQINMSDNKQIEGDDEVITVTMPRGDYKIMREMIRDRKSTSFVMNKVKVFSLTLSGVVAAWWMLGEKFLEFLKKALQ